MVCASDDTLWVALFNGRPRDIEAITNEIDASLWRARKTIEHWPEHNLFERYQ